MRSSIRERAAQLALTACLAIAIQGSAARAEVKALGERSFETVNVASINADPQHVFALLSNIGSWWDSQHTFSGDARNLSLDLRPGGCFCERLSGGGGVLHLTVVYVVPGKSVRLRGALGPLQDQAVDGAMTWTIEPEGKGSKVTLTYVVSGEFNGGPKAWARPVDFVLSNQLGRLKSFAEQEKR